MAVALIVLPVLLIITAVAINIGRLIYANREAQAAADAAALSAVAGVPYFNASSASYATAAQRSVTLAQQFNGAGSAQETNSVLGMNPEIGGSNLRFMQYELPYLVGSQQFDYANEKITYYQEGVTPLPLRRLDVNGVEIQRSYDVPLFLGKLIGKQSVPITVSARAFIGGPTCFPIRLPYVLIHNFSNSTGANACAPTLCGKNTLHTIRQTPSTSDNAAIWALEGSVNASDCVNRVKNPNAAVVLCAGQTIELNNGAVTSCLKEVQQQCNLVNCSSTTPWYQAVPVIDANEICYTAPGTTCNPVQSIKIKGFARIGITYIKEPSDAPSAEYPLIDKNDRVFAYLLSCGELQTGVRVGAASCNFYGLPVLTN